MEEDKYLQRTQALSALVARHNGPTGKGGIAAVARQAGLDPSYVQRMLYPPGKAGRKRIGEDSVDRITNAFPEWLQEHQKAHTKNQATISSAASSGATTGRHIKAEQIANRLNAIAYQLTAEDWGAINKLIDGLEALHPKKRNKAPEK